MAKEEKLHMEVPLCIVCLTGNEYPIFDNKVQFFSKDAGKTSFNV